MGLGFDALGLGFRALALGCRASDMGVRSWGLGQAGMCGGRGDGGGRVTVVSRWR